MQDIKMTAQIVEKLRSLSAAADRCCTNDIEIHLVATWNSCMCVCVVKNLFAAICGWFSGCHCNLYCSRSCSSCRCWLSTHCVCCCHMTLLRWPNKSQCCNRLRVFFLPQQWLQQRQERVNAIYRKALLQV